MANTKTTTTASENANRREFIKGSARETLAPGKGKVNTFINLSFKVDQLEVDEKGYARFALLKKDSVDQYGNSYALLEARSRTE